MPAPAKHESNRAGLKSRAYVEVEAQGERSLYSGLRILRSKDDNRANYEVAQGRLHWLLASIDPPSIDVASVKCCEVRSRQREEFKLIQFRHVPI